MRLPEISSIMLGPFSFTFPRKVNSRQLVVVLFDHFADRRILYMPGCGFGSDDRDAMEASATILRKTLTEVKTELSEFTERPVDLKRVRDCAEDIHVACVEFDTNLNKEGAVSGDVVHEFRKETSKHILDLSASFGVEIPKIMKKYMRVESS